MSDRTIRWLGFGLVSTAGVLALTAMMTPALASGEAPADPATIGLVMGGSGIPLPEAYIPGYVQAVNDLYVDNPLHPNFPGTSYPDPYANGLFTPEYPLLSMPMSINYPTVDGFPALTTSMGQGMNIVENAIASNKAAGDASTVFGWSQSSTISGLVMQQLDPTGTPMPNDGLQFVLVGDPSAPNGGLLERFVGLNLPSLGLSFDGATPVNSFPTDIYSLEYDGFTDFPKYPINFLADLNAVLGTVTIHGEYLSLSAEQIANATLLPGSAALGTPDSLTNYYMIDQTPPLVTLLSDIPVVGKPLADLLGPDVTVLINLGYGADNVGYSTPANVPTPFGLFPDVNLATVLTELAGATQQGSAAFVSDLSHLSLPSLLQAVSSAVTAVTAAPTAIPTGTDIVEGITKAVYSLWTLGYQTGDIVNAAVTSLPAYDVSLFLNNLGNPLDAVGLPIAADVAGLTMIAGFEFELIERALSAVIADLGL
ncbi:MAG TPA: PE-PPE domain-containing protein [Mycobacterium sp.]|nr:PE-PPE domain-containing protein [Mycobacterium sp.]